MQESEKLSPAELVDVWRARAAELRHFAAEGAARAFEHCAEQLAAALRRHDDETLTLAEAARESGYSAESLGRLVRRGAIPNAGREHAPRIRRSDLPHKPARVAAAPARAYDPVADARTLQSRRSRRSA